MAAFSDVGATCAFASCRRQVYLPFVCDACSQTFCEEHARHDAHECPAVASSGRQEPLICPQVSQASVRRCAAKGCREQLASHNTVHCWRCRQDVCIRHRFEDDHSCVPIDVAVGQALGKARQDMGAEGYAEAHSTLLKVFGNIIKDPNNEKFRTLKKENAVVKQKLNHPACIQALLTCGFQDMGDVYMCRSGADLALMRKMQSALQKNPPGEAVARPSAGYSGGGTRLVNGVIVREAPAPAPPPAAVASAPARTAPVPAGEPPFAKNSSAPAPAKPKSAFDFGSRSKREQAEKAQQDALQEARSLQKDRYKTAGASEQTSTQAKAKAVVVPPGQSQQQSQQQSGGDCVLQ